MVFSSAPSAPPADGAEHPPAANAPPAADGNGGEDKMEGKRGTRVGGWGWLVTEHLEMCCNGPE